MKKLLPLLFFLLLSFNSYGEWIYIDKEKNSDAEIYVLTESIEVEDGYVYWTYLNNYSKPRSEYNIMGLAIFRGADCENNRYVNIESQMFQGSMGSEPFGDRLKPEQEWTTPTLGQIDEKIFNFVCEYAGLVSAQVEAEEESDQSRFSYLKNPENIKNHYVKDKETGKWKDLKKEEPQTYAEKLAVFKEKFKEKEMLDYAQRRLMGNNNLSIFRCKVLAETFLWDKEPHITFGETKDFIFEKTNKTVKFVDDGEWPFYGVTLNIIKEEDSSDGARFEASSDNSKLMYFYSDERNIYGDSGRFKYTELGAYSGIKGMFGSLLASCNPIKLK